MPDPFLNAIACVDGSAVHLVPVHALGALASLLLPGREWLWPALAILGIGLVILVRSYRSTPARGAVRVTCLSLKALGLVALALCLLDPAWVSQRAKPGANYFAVLVDNSQGLQLKDGGDGRSRAEQLRETLNAGESTWMARLEEAFELRRYSFDTRLQALQDFDGLAFDGHATALGGALRGLASRFEGQPLAGILLISDGNATDMTEAELDLAGLPPIHPVVIGTDDLIHDIAIRRVSVRQTDFEDAPVTAQVDVTAHGYGSRVLFAELHDPQGKLVERQTSLTSRQAEPLTFRFQFQPESAGLSLYAVRVGAEDDRDGAEEATLANNQQLVVVDRRGGPFRVLYMGGRPNWEYKFLQRALAEDDQLQLVGLLRLAHREPRFEFRGRAGESTNPLFRGFDRTTEETERYDQPVLVRLNTRDAVELAGGFPKKAEDLYPYHAVILDNIEAAFFTRDQLSLLQKFVSERGAGFLMLGGAESFHEGGYDRTPVGAMLPVYLDRAPPGESRLAFRLDLTREGWLQPWLRTRPSEAAERSRLDQMPPFLVLNRVRDVKPGASVLATVADNLGKTHPALVTQRYGVGRTATWLIGDLWRGGFHDSSAQEDLQKAWRQLIRWLVTDVPERVVADHRTVSADPGQAVQVSVSARDELFRPLENATVTLSVRHIPNPAPAASAAATPPLTTPPMRLTAEPSLAEPGLYQTLFVPREPGGYIAEAVAIDGDGAEAGRAETGWTADPAAAEFQSLVPNRSLMAALARQTGGSVVSAGDLNRFIDELQQRPAPVMETWIRPLWHQPAVFLFALFCFVAEWGLRRSKGLA
jgi:uncharacterized membrane protein